MLLLVGYLVYLDTLFILMTFSQHTVALTRRIRASFSGFGTQRRRRQTHTHHSAVLPPGLSTSEFSHTRRCVALALICTVTMSATFVVEYARSNRASCKDTRCKGTISKDELRIGKVSPSPFDPDSTMVRVRPARSCGEVRSPVVWGCPCVRRHGIMQHAFSTP